MVHNASIYLCFFALIIINTSTCADASTPNKSLRLTFGISDLYTPYLTPKENADVLESLKNNVRVGVTYKHTSSKFKWTSNMSGVTGFISPGYVDSSTEQSRTFELSTDKQWEPGVDIPQSLDGGYILKRLYISVSPNAFYQQSGYRDLVRKASKGDNEKYDPSFEYDVLIRTPDSTADANSSEHQQCLDILTPLGIPDIPIPVVVNATIDSKNIKLIGNNDHKCPLTRKNYTNTSSVISGHPPSVRIASAQADIDYSGADGVKFISGTLPVTENMARLYHSSSTSVSALVREYGPFEEFSINIRGDTTNSVGGVLPIQTESWNFFNKN